MERCGEGFFGTASLGGMDGDAAGRSAASAGGAGCADRASERGGGRGRGRPSSGTASEDAAGSGSDYGVGLCADDRRCEPVQAQRAGGQLCRLDPARALFGRQAQRLGAISKQGNGFMRQLLVEAVQTTCRLDEGFRKQYQARCHHKAKGVAKVAAARRLAVRLYWMLKQNVGYPEIACIESSPRVPLAGTNEADGLNGRSR